MWKGEISFTLTKHWKLILLKETAKGRSVARGGQGDYSYLSEAMHPIVPCDPNKITEYIVIVQTYRLHYLPPVKCSPAPTDPLSTVQMLGDPAVLCFPFSVPAAGCRKAKKNVTPSTFCPSFTPWRNYVPLGDTLTGDAAWKCRLSFVYLCKGNWAMV